MFLSLLRGRMDVKEKYNFEISSFGKKLRQFRKRKKLIQLQLEMLSGIDRSEISKIENGQKNVEFFTIVKLAMALGVEPYEFLLPENLVVHEVQKSLRKVKNSGGRKRRKK